MCSAYHGLAGIRAGVDMAKFHSRRSPDEFYVEELEKLLKNPQTQKNWNDIVTMDPMGMFATRPTQSGKKNIEKRSVCVRSPCSFFLPFVIAFVFVIEFD